jgi:hypothetical protein
MHVAVSIAYTIWFVLLACPNPIYSLRKGSSYRDYLVDRQIRIWIGLDMSIAQW